MSLKAELETWSAALQAYDAEDFENSLELFSHIAGNSRILTNMGLIYATLGEHETAVEKFIEATTLDQHLAVAYFQCGVSNFLLGRFQLSLKDFEEAWMHLRGNSEIRYQQLGLKFVLFSAEILFNKGLSQIYMGRTEEGLSDLEAARNAKATEEHDVIDEAIEHKGEGYTVFSIPVGVLYRPAEAKVKNSRLKDFMGKAKLVASSDSGDTFTSFSGATRLKQGIAPGGVYIESLRTDILPLARSNTTSRSQPESERGRPPLLPSATTKTNMLRANSTITTAKASMNPRISEPGIYTSLNTTTNQPLAENIIPDRSARITELYDEYFQSYGEPPPLPPPVSRSFSPFTPGSKANRIAAWAQNNTKETAGYPQALLQKEQSRSAPSTVYAGSVYGSIGHGSVRRKFARRTQSRLGYEEEEEGYVSGGEFEEGPFELHKIRVKLHYRDDLRGMTLSPNVSFKEFVRMLMKKFGSVNGVMLKFKDEDGGMISLLDESDYELAIETARESSKGRPEGKLEVWCTDIPHGNI